MSPRRAGLLLLLLLPSPACSEEPTPNWTRVVRHDYGDNFSGYSIIQADPITNTCVRVELLSDSNLPLAQPGEVDVDWRGLEGHVIRSALGTEADPDYPSYSPARRCTNEQVPNDLGPPDPIISGKLHFDEDHRQDAGRPCRVSFDLSLQQHPIWDDPTTESYSLRADDIAIYDQGCPHPDDFQATYTELDAAFAELDGLGTVVVSSWDANYEVCVWARFLSSDAELSSISEVEAPGTWAYSGLRVADIEREACVASELVQPNAVSADWSRSAGPLISNGNTEFSSTTTVQTASGPVEAPCELDIDVALQSFGEFYWVPSIINMRGNAIAVSGSCD